MFYHTNKCRHVLEDASDPGDGFGTRIYDMLKCHVVFLALFGFAQVNNFDFLVKLSLCPRIIEAWLTLLSALPRTAWKFRFSSGYCSPSFDFTDIKSGKELNVENGKWKKWKEKNIIAILWVKIDILPLCRLLQPQPSQVQAGVGETA